MCAHIAICYVCFPYYKKRLFFEIRRELIFRRTKRNAQVNLPCAGTMAQQHTTTTYHACGFNWRRRLCFELRARAHFPLIFQQNAISLFFFKSASICFICKHTKQSNQRKDRNLLVSFGCFMFQFIAAGSRFMFYLWRFFALSLVRIVNVSCLFPHLPSVQRNSEYAFSESSHST